MKRAAIAVIALLFACQSSSDGPIPSPIPGPGDYSRTIVSGGLERSYELHVPPAWGSLTQSGGLVGRTSREISASDAAVRFFLDHVR